MALRRSPLPQEILPILHRIDYLAGNDITDQLRERDRITGAGRRLVAISGHLDGGWKATLHVFCARPF
jgi:hypothetical protein